MKKKIVSLALAIAMCFSLLTFAAPVAGAAYVYEPEPTKWQEIRSSLVAYADKRFPGFSTLVDFPTQFVFPHVGSCTPEEMAECQRYFNDNYIGRISRMVDGSKWFADFTDYWDYALLVEDTEKGIWRLADAGTGHWLTDANGDFPFLYMNGDIPEAEGDQWCSASGSDITNSFNTVSRQTLSDFVTEYNGYGHSCDQVKVKIGPKGKEVECWAIRDDNWNYLCNYKGDRYACPIEPSVTETVRPSIDNSGNLIEGDNGLILDVEDNVLNLIGQLGDQFQLNIDDMVFDFGTNSYTVNAYTTVNEGDNYYYTYYTYNVQYNITNTYITYIGSNEPYEREEYELYYELPDGRSSADLTAEEIAGMSFEFYDVMNYSRSTDDVTVRGLYHFDGNLDDSSYFTEPDRITWNDGASITYMESPGAFGGNLYLDNTAHSFNVRGTAKFAKEDFTIQFRYYQASEPDTQDNVENFLSGDASLLSNAYLLKWDESSLYDMNGNLLAALPVGTWNEIAVIRHQGFLFYYLNGHCVGQSDQRVVMGDTITFSLGDTSRAYSMIDELRILNFAFVTGAADYTPTTVPHDSNLVLILPNAARPIADEYIEIKTSGTNLLGCDLNSFVSCISDGSFPLKIDASHSSLIAYSDSVLLTRLTTTDLSPLKYGSYTVYGKPCAGLFRFVGDLGLSASTSYTLSVVLADGSVYSMPFVTDSSTFYGKVTGGPGYLISQGWQNGRIFKQLDFPGGSLIYGRFANGVGSNGLCPEFDSIIIRPETVDGAILDIMYIELVKGDADLTAEKITAVYDAEDLEPNTAAIQTTIPVKGYTVGGVRPSMPAKGDLWFPVMENRISSVQIYTGTHWEEVNARWYTGTRWIPIYAFDITTLEDLFDIADGDSVVPLLPDQNSFLRWWQLQWLDFRNWLENALSSSGSGGGTSLPDDDTLPGEDATDEEDGWSFVDLLVKTKDGIWKITKGIVRTAAGGITGLVVLINDAGSFFDPYQDGYSEGVGDLMNYGGDDIWD